MDFGEIKANLENYGYEVSCFENVQDANEHLNKAIDGVSVGIGGTMTFVQMGAYESLKAHNKILWHMKPEEGLTAQELRHLSGTADVYISSANAISKTGEIVNIDNNCDRVANTLYGHKKVFFVIGKNKIADTLEDAIFRARNVAAPLNAKRLNRKTPCAINGDKCYDCNSPDRICRGLSVLWRKPAGCEYEVVLINEDLGF